jgi:hypothetical protein
MRGRPSVGGSNLSTEGMLLLGGTGRADESCSAWQAGRLIQRSFALAKGIASRLLVL